MLRPGGCEDDVVAAEVEVNEAITADGVGNADFEVGKTLDMAGRPDVKTVDRLVEELLPMTEQAGMRFGTRLQIVSPFDNREPLDETEESRRRRRCGAVRPASPRRSTR